MPKGIITQGTDPMQPKPYKFSLDGLDPGVKELIINGLDDLDPNGFDAITRSVLIENGSVLKKVRISSKITATNAA